MSIYFESIANLLSFYPYVHDSYAVVEPRRVLNNHSYDESSTGMRDKSLTARQRTILELIQEGQTNLQIAGVIGYSESLVRQESVLIYAKLGIRGRIDLAIKSKISKVAHHDLRVK